MKSDLVLDKFSLPQNHALLVAQQVFKSVRKEVHVNDLIKRVAKKRRSIGNVSDEARILKGIGLLIAFGKLKYYKGLLFKDAA